MNRNEITMDRLLALYKVNDFRINEVKGKDFALNIGAIRTKSRSSEKYDDYMFVFRKCPKPANHTVNKPDWQRVYQNGYSLDIFTCTTNPGTPNMLKPVNPKGAGIIVEGQYKDVYIKGLHKGKPALVQFGTFKVYRDKNKDSILDYDPLTIENAKNTGFNIHHASEWKISEIIGLYSAGCQVHKNVNHFKEVFMYLINSSINEGFKFFDYTLITEEQYEDISKLIK